MRCPRSIRGNYFSFFFLGTHLIKKVHKKFRPTVKQEFTVKKMGCVFFMFLILSLLQSAKSLYFHLAENSQKCFIEDLPQNTLVRASYTNLDYNAEFPIHITVLDPSAREVTSHFCNERDSVVFTSDLSGLVNNKITQNRNKSSLWFNSSHQEHQPFFIVCFFLFICSIFRRVRTLRSYQEFSKS